MTLSGRARRTIVVVMGVSGSGKTTVGQLLAERLGVDYAEADAFHPPENIAKMSSGQPLNDEDRLPWLASIAVWITDRLAAGDGGVASCSALRARYRDVLGQGGPGTWFLHLDTPRELIVARVSGRRDHFMPVSLVDSQFAALEPLRPGEAGMAVDGSLPVDEIVNRAVDGLTAYWASTRPGPPPVRLPGRSRGSPA
ncbi:gluconokinase [Parafrankia irregularis]|uniref:Gluconokinase n=2 Tax=Frankiaceae TaxID=74712 RepID=A0A0S4QR19_9ACTN|nr:MULTISPECIES: gluconokinase [Parafrankia]CUU58048.1 gluconokinase [Parafrankia irregularis]